MTSVDFINELFCRIADVMDDIPNHPQAKLYSSEIVTLEVLFALKGVGNRQWYRWLKRDYLPLFPDQLDCTRFFRLFATHHQDCTDQFLVELSLLSVIDSYEIELIRPVREGAPTGAGLWGKLCFLLNHFDQVINWACATANVHDTVLHPLI